MNNFSQINKKNTLLFLLIAFISIITITYFSPITQNNDYHNFAEQRMFLSIPHIGDVISNLSFIIVGLLLLKIHVTHTLYNGQKTLFTALALSCILLGLGSGYYHWNPNNYTLAYDRATMVIGFAVIFYDSIIRYQIVPNKHICTNMFAIMLMFLLTVFIWCYTGRLESYVFVQFFTMFALVILAVTNYKNIYSKHLFFMFIWYAIAKLCENYDKQIFNITNDLISGHTLKHIAYAISLYVFGKNMLNNENVNNRELKDE